MFPATRFFFLFLHGWFMGVNRGFPYLSVGARVRTPESVAVYAQMVEQ